MKMFELSVKVFYKVINKFRRKKVIASFCEKNKIKEFTIISQNCIGGVIYSDLGLPFQSPTINMFIEDENFVKLVENLEYYMSIPAVPKVENYVDSVNVNIRYPKILVGDIELCCLHYQTCAEAIEAWERRKKRINWDKVYVIANSWNLHNQADFIERVASTKYKTVIFTVDKYDCEKCIQLPGEFWKVDERGIVRPNLTDFMPNSPYKYFESFFDFVGWLNE